MNRKLSLEELKRHTPEAFKEVEKHDLIVVLDNIRSKHNVGSVFRTADAFCIKQIVLGGFTPKPPDRDIRKTAIGATETVDWISVEEPLQHIAGLKRSGYTIVSVEQTEKSVQLNDFKTAVNKVCLVLGNEVGGVDQEIIDISDFCIEIPQFGTKHSLNVSVCAGIVMWEMIQSIT